MEKDDLVEDVKELLEVLESETQYWKLSVVLRMVDELARLERIANPSYYWNGEYLRDKYVRR